MFEGDDHDLVHGLEPRPQISLGDQVDSFSRPTNENDFFGAPRAEKIHGPHPCPLVGIRSFLAESVNPSMDVGVVLAVVITN